jgi:hypothetical protein
LTFQLREQLAREQAPLPDPGFASSRPLDGEAVATFHRDPQGFLIRILDRADFLIALDTGVVTCWPVPGSSRSVRDLYLNQVLPSIEGHQGQLVIHASGVAIGGRAAAFVAPTGRGKSTLAAAFARAGMPFLSDDGLHLIPVKGHYLANPNRPSFRLWRDSMAAVGSGAPAPEEGDEVDKSRVEAGDGLPFQAIPIPLQAMYFLGPGEVAKPCIVALSMRDALARLLNHSFFLDAEDRERMKRHFEALTRLAEAVPSFDLDYPREYDLLPDAIEAVKSHDAMKERAA